MEARELDLRCEWYRERSILFGVEDFKRVGKGVHDIRVLLININTNGEMRMRHVP
jgi:hypothetical protein